jgi:hypothetical protein
MGGAGSDTITGTTPGTALPPKFIVLGDAGRAEFNGSGQLLDIFTKSANTGAGDTINLANADDVVLGGDGGDTIDAAEGSEHRPRRPRSCNIRREQASFARSTAPTPHPVATIRSISVRTMTLSSVAFGKETLAANGGNNIILGDAGQANFAADGQLLEIFTTAPADGDNDHIITGLGDDLIMGGTANDTITDAGGQQYRSRRQRQRHFRRRRSSARRSHHGQQLLLAMTRFPPEPATISSSVVQAMIQFRPQTATTSSWVTTVRSCLTKTDCSSVPSRLTLSTLATIQSHSRLAMTSCWRVPAKTLSTLVTETTSFSATTAKRSSIRHEFW